MSLTEFYAGKTILLTGATGFLGKVILEKICRSLPVVSKIYVGVRPKDSTRNSEYQHFKQNILDSQIFDRLKLDLGLKRFNRLIKEKLVPIPLDLIHPTLNLSEQLRGQIASNLNMIINSAASVDLNVSIDMAVRINVSGPLKLLELAQSCPNFVTFVQASSCFVNSDRTGYIEEKLYDSENTNWQAELDKILLMSKLQLHKSRANIIRGFPDVYTWSKRMAEELLVHQNNLSGKSPIPMLIIRPSIIAAAISEPMPGWTDTEGLLSGLTLAMGMGVMKHMPGNPDYFLDVIPVDIVARQLLVAAALCRFQAERSQGKDNLLIVQSSSSGSNPISAGKFFADVVKYQNNFPYANRAGPASFTMFKNMDDYDWAFRYKQQLPSQALFYLTRVLGTKKFANDVVELKKGVEQVRQANISFKFYTTNEWVFDNANSQKLELFLKSSNNGADADDWIVNVKQVEWTPFAMNHAYGVKRYLLHEEAAVPSEGFGDSLVPIRNFKLTDLVPWSKKINWEFDVRPTKAMEQLILETDSVKEAIGDIVSTKLDYYKNTLQLDVDENKIYQDTRKEASESLRVIMANYKSNALRVMCHAHVQIFKRIYSQIIVNETQLARIRKLAEQKRGPVVMCPTHRSYVDFLILSVVLIFYKIDAPHICAGEDLMHIKGVSAFLRMCGAFFMRRTFRGDPLYKAIFTEYVTQLTQDKTVMEFFVEGTRSRSNKMLSPKFGILQIMSSTFFDKKVEEISFVPVNINYTRTLEDSSFPGELTGMPKVKENLGRIVSAAETLNMNYGALHLDFHDPIHISEEVKAVTATQDSSFDPYKNRKDRQFFNNKLGLKLVYTLQDNIMVMPTHLVATIVLLYRKGISEETLAKQVTWLGMACLQRGAKLSDSGLPYSTTVKEGLKHLSDYLTKKRDVYMPKVIRGSDQNEDNASYIMLNYYRNPLLHLFFSESLVACSLLSFGVDMAWKKGINKDELFQRTCYLSDLLKREEVQQKRITLKTREYFDETLQKMEANRLMHFSKGPDGQEIVHPKSSGEATMLLICSFVWPLIDSYYFVSVFALSLVKRKDVEEATFSKDVQWVSENMYMDGKINYSESCNQQNINNAKAALLEMGVLAKKSIYINLASEYQKEEGERRIEKLIETISQYRNLPISQKRALEEFSPDGELRRKVFADFPIMAKL